MASKIKFLSAISSPRVLARIEKLPGQKNVIKLGLFCSPTVQKNMQTVNMLKQDWQNCLYRDKCETHIMKGIKGIWKLLAKIMKQHKGDAVIVF